MRDHDEKNPMGVPGTTSELKRVLGRALIDSDFRELLFRDRQTALQRYELNPADQEALSRLDEKTLMGARDVAAIVGMVCAAGGGTTRPRKE